MKKSLFSRYFYMCASIILASIAVLGVMLLAFSAQYFKQDSMNLLTRNAKQISNLVASNYKANDYEYIDSQVVRASFTVLSGAIDADIFLVDTSGRTILCSHTGACNHKTYLIAPEIMDQALSGGYKGVTKLGGIYQNANYTVGVPVVEDGVAIASVFASSSATRMNDFLMEVLNMFLLGSAIVIVIAFVIIYFSTDMLVRPLRAMANATVSFAQGDFSARVPVEGYDEVEKLATAFNNMASSLAAHESTRRSFIANVSHELKTPMTTIAGFIDGILDGTIPRGMQDHYLGIVSQEVKRLSRLVVSMLNIAKIEAGEMPLKPQQVEINDIVCQTVFTFEQRIEEKRIDVRGLDAEKTFVEADPDLLHQIVYNLIENAVKFTPAGGYLEFTYRTDGGMVATSIKNSGAGIAKEELPKLFDRFYKSDKSRSMDKNGVGLGLHIVKTLVQLHSGKITVKSVEGEYAEFEFTLPAAPQKGGQALFRKGEKQNSSKS